MQSMKLPISPPNTFVAFEKATHAVSLTEWRLIAKEGAMFDIGGKKLKSRLLIGSALYDSPEIMLESIRASKSDIVTVSLRRQSPDSKAGQDFWNLIQSLGIEILPNTAGCKSVKEAITTAKMARELFETNWIKLEVIGDDYTLQPDPIALIEAATELIKDGFEVFPYTTEDYIVARRLMDAGCKIVMPWAAPIGSGQGLLNPYALGVLRERLPDITLVVDAGLRTPSEAAKVMEMGYDAVLVNSAIARATNPIAMGEAFSEAVGAGRKAFEAGMMTKRNTASPSTPVTGTPFWHNNPS